VDSAPANVLANTRWTECRWILAVGSNYYFNRRNFEFTADGRMVVTAQDYFSDQSCQKKITAAQVQQAFGRHPVEGSSYVHRYQVSVTPNSEGVYAFDMNVNGQITYTSMKIEGPHLMIGSAYNVDTDEPAELAMSGMSPETRAYTIGKLPLYYSLFR
jgi:hypothetical protein